MLLKLKKLSSFSEIIDNLCKKIIILASSEMHLLIESRKEEKIKEKVAIIWLLCVE